MAGEDFWESFRIFGILEVANFGWCCFLGDFVALCGSGLGLGEW